MPKSSENYRPGTTYAAVLGRVLAFHREQSGFEQAELASSLNIGQSSWSRIERGDSVINVEQLRAVARKFGIPAHELVSEADAASDNLEARNVEVRTTKSSKVEGEAIAWMALGALATAVIAVISRK